MLALLSLRACRDPPFSVALMMNHVQEEQIWLELFRSFRGALRLNTAKQMPRHESVSRPVAHQPLGSVFRV